MRELIKAALAKVWPLISSVIPWGDFRIKIQEKVEMYSLKRVDPARWRVLQARKMGAVVGENCRFYSLNFFSEPYLIEIGNDVIISGEVVLVTHDGGIYLFKDEVPDIRGYYGKIKIGNNCFIGMGAIILPNVEIGSNCIVGAGAVVASSIPENSVVMGNPAKVVFKTDMYKKMRKKSPYMVRHEQYPFPTRIPENIKRELLISHFKKLPAGIGRRKA